MLYNTLIKAFGGIMKRITLRVCMIFLALITLISAFPACTQNEDPEVTTPKTDPDITATETDPPAESETEAVTEEPKSYITINASNAGSVKVIKSSALDRFSIEQELYSAFRKNLNSALGVTIATGTDTGSSETGYEILFGSTSRELSVQLEAKLNETGVSCYGIIAEGNKIAVSGTNTYLLYKGLDYLLVNCISKDDSGNLQLKIEDGFELIEQKDVEFPNPEEIINSGKEYAFYSVDKLADVPTKGNYSVLEGGGTDGKYAYYAMISKSTKPETAYIYKYDIKTWELVSTSKSLPTAHTNDITYDSKNHRLVVSYCSSKEGTTMSSSGIVFVNPDDLSFIEYIDVPTLSRALDYIPEKNQYVLAAGYNFYLTDENFNTVSTFTCGYPKLTTQGLCTDGKYIYDPRWQSGAKYQTITINTLDGKFVGAIPLYGIDGEPENIFRDGNSFVMGCNKSDAVFRLALLYKDWWG